MSTWSTAIFMTDLQSETRPMGAGSGSRQSWGGSCSVDQPSGGDCYSFHREDFDHVAHLQVVVVLQADAALEPGLDLAHVVLEAPQRGDLAFEYHDVVAEQPCLRLAGSRNAAIGDHAPGDRPDLRYLEDLAHFGAADSHFFERRLEETGHALLDLLGDVVDHRVHADIDLLALGHVLRVAIGPYVEADDDGVRGRGEQHVRLVDSADARADDANLDLLVRQLGQRIGQHFSGALHVGLDDERKFLDAAFGDLLLERFEREAAALGAERAFLRLRLTERRNLARLRGIGDGLERIPRLRQAGQAEHFHWRRRSGRLRRTSAIVDECADSADHRASNEVVPDAERAVLHQHSRHRTASAIQLGLEHRTRRAALRVRAQLEDVSRQQNHLEQLIEVLPLLGRDGHHHGLAAPVFRHEIQLCQLTLDVVGVHAWLVDLVDRHDDGHVRSLGVIDRFARLRHDAVIGGDDQDDDIGDLGAARTHQRKRFVTWRVEEDDAAVIADVDVVSADVLSDTASFAFGDFGFADGVEQRGLAVIDVTHHGDDRRARLQVLGTRLVAFGGDQLFLEAAHLDLGAELACDVLGVLDIERAVDGHHHALHQQLREHVLHAHVELVGEILHRHAFGQRDRASDRRRRRRRRLGARRRGTLASGLHGPRLTHGSLLSERRTLLPERRTLTRRSWHTRARLLRLLRTYRLRGQRTWTTEHARRGRTRR